jgi:D-arginine dehydrogenase
MATIVEFLIIGGGIAGASAAYYFAPHGKTVMLEMESQPGYHSTGRSAAIFSEYHGPELICQLARASHDLYKNPPEEFADTPILSDRGMLFVGTHEDTEKSREMLEASLGRAATLQSLAAAEALKLVPFLNPDHAVVAISYPGAQEMDVAALHNGYLRGLKSRGARLLTNAAAIQISRQANTWLVSTAREVFEAGTIINAAGAWADQVAGLAGLQMLGLVPKRRTVMTVDLPSDYANQLYPMVISLDQKFYFKTETGSLMASPMDTTPVAAQDVQPEEIDIAGAAWLLQERTSLKVHRIKRSWAGLRSFLPDDAPVVARDPQAENFIWLAGQGGYGIKTCDAMGRCAVSIALTGDLPPDIKRLGITREQLGAGRTYGPKTSLIS